MTDQQIQAQLNELLARDAETQLEEMQAKTAAAVGLVVVTLTRDTFLRSLGDHCNTLADHGNTEIQQIIRDVNGALNEAADRLAFITKESDK